MKLTSLPLLALLNPIFQYECRSLVRPVLPTRNREAYILTAATTSVVAFGIYSFKHVPAQPLHDPRLVFLPAVKNAPVCPVYLSSLLRARISPVPVIPSHPAPTCINRHLIPSFEIPESTSPIPPSITRKPRNTTTHLPAPLSSTRGRVFIACTFAFSVILALACVYMFTFRYFLPPVIRRADNELGLVLDISAPHPNLLAPEHATALSLPSFSVPTQIYITGLDANTNEGPVIHVHYVIPTALITKDISIDNELRLVDASIQITPPTPAAAPIGVEPGIESTSLSQDYDPPSLLPTVMHCISISTSPSPDLSLQTSIWAPHPHSDTRPLSATPLVEVTAGQELTRSDSLGQDFDLTDPLPPPLVSLQSSIWTPHPSDMPPIPVTPVRVRSEIELSQDFNSSNLNIGPSYSPARSLQSSVWAPHLHSNMSPIAAIPSIEIRPETKLTRSNLPSHDYDSSTTDPSSLSLQPSSLVVNPSVEVKLETEPTRSDFPARGSDLIGALPSPTLNLQSSIWAPRLHPDAPLVPTPSVEIKLEMESTRPASPDRYSDLIGPLPSPALSMQSSIWAPRLHSDTTLVVPPPCQIRSRRVGKRVGPTVDNESGNRTLD